MNESQMKLSSSQAHNLLNNFHSKLAGSLVTLFVKYFQLLKANVQLYVAAIDGGHGRSENEP